MVSKSTAVNMNLPPHQRPNVIAPDSSTKRVALGLVGGECADLTVHDTASPGTLYANAGFLSGYSTIQRNGNWHF